MRRPFFFPFFFIPLAFLAALAVMLLWNAIIPDLLHANEIGYWQSLGLIVLSRILFGGFHCGQQHFMKHRWEKMTPEEREKMRSSWRSRCSWYDEPPTSETK